MSIEVQQEEINIMFGLEVLDLHWHQAAIKQVVQGEGGFQAKTRMLNIESQEEEVIIMWSLEVLDQHRYCTEMEL